MESQRNKNALGCLAASNQGKVKSDKSSIVQNPVLVNTYNSANPVQPLHLNPLASAYVELMERFEPFQLYGHLTARDIPGKGLREVKTGHSRFKIVQDRLAHHIHPESFKKAFGRFGHSVNREIFGSRYWKRPEDGVTWFSGFEDQKRGAIHCHFVMGRVPKEVNTYDWRIGLNEKWFEHVGIGRIFEYDPSQGGGFYLAKSAYMFKKGDIDFGGPLTRAAREKLL